MSVMWMPPQTTRPPFLTALSAIGTSAPTGSREPADSLRIRCPSEGRLGALECLAHEMGGGRLVLTEVLVERTGIVSLYAGVKDYVRQSLAPSPGFHRSH
jgi:hypothetical protein